MNKSEFKPSQFQSTIFEAILECDDNLIVNAVAGSGKTTTAIKSMGYLPNGQSILFCAFNVSIVKELAVKVEREYPEQWLNRQIDVINIHKLGYALIRSYHNRSKFKVTKGKYWDLMVEWLSDRHNPDTSTKGELIKTISLAMLNGIRGINEPEETFRFLENLEPDIDLKPEDFCRLYEYVIAEGLELVGEGIVDFNDMLFYPYFKKIKSARSYNTIFIDECQDLSVCQANVCLAYGSRLTRYILVGDPRQAIYGFAGADSNSFHNLKDMLECEEYPLSTCYRCSKLIVAQAAVLVPQITSFEDAADGEVATVEWSELIERIERLGDQDLNESAFLSRTKAQCMKAFLALTVAGFGSYIVGKDIGQDLIKLVREIFPSESLENFNDQCDRVFSAKSKKLKKSSSVSALKDKFEALEHLYCAKDFNSRSDLINCLSSIFDDNAKNLITISTIHKAKGKEWLFVALNSDKLPLTYPKQKPSEYQQELNLKYVALTRAKMLLLKYEL